MSYFGSHFSNNNEREVQSSRRQEHTKVLQGIGFQNEPELETITSTREIKDILYKKMTLYKNSGVWLYLCPNKRYNRQTYR